jgi:hypothetical protein
MPYDEKIIKHFWEHVAICPHGLTCVDCCWPWRGKSYKGYGIVTVYDKELYTSTGRAARTIRIPRVALEIGKQAPITEGLWALHRCNNPPCCNYNEGHLYEGTPKDNARDAIQAGSHVSVVKAPGIIRGDNHWTRRHPERIGMSKKTTHPFSLIQTIRHLFMAGFPVGVLAEIFELRTGYVSEVVRHETRLYS